MTLRELADEPFFREWKARKRGERRSLRRADRVASLLKLDRLPFPLLTVVGSKGKATTAIYASATLASAGIRVGTLTSPPIISNRERIRINGVAISLRAYQEISEHLSHVLEKLPRDEFDGGYLSPSGLFTMMGLRYMVEAGCDAAVLEAGMGGKSDEVSLFSPSVVAITTIFGEHIGILGNNVQEIAYDKASVVCNGTKAVLTTRQSSDVEEVIRAVVEQNGCTLDLVESCEQAIARSVTIPAGLSGLNAHLGIQAARRFLELIRISISDDSNLPRVLSSVRTPGRLSIHRDPAGRDWIVDAAINESGVVATLGWVEEHLGKIDVVFVSIPSGKDIVGVRRALANQSYVPVKLETEHLEFDDNQWGTDLVSFAELSAHVKGERILAIGTWSFVGAVLNELGVDYETAYLP